MSYINPNNYTYATSIISNTTNYHTYTDLQGFTWNCNCSMPASHSNLTSNVTASGGITNQQYYYQQYYYQWNPSPTTPNGFPTKVGAIKIEVECPNCMLKKVA